MIYLYAKSIHIIFVICWMAGLFYVVRLFVYHTEAKQKNTTEYEILHRQFQVMEKRLWWVITTPSMYLTIIAGVVMLTVNPTLLQTPWMHVKLCFVLALVLYHFKCQQIIKNLALERNQWSSTKLRLWNEVSTILLFAIVFIVVLKSAVNWIFGLVALVSLAVILMIAVKMYKRYREKRSDSNRTD